MRKILFTGGGSAGHVMPNIALIDELKNNSEIFYIGTDGIEKTLTEKLKIPFYTIQCPKFRRNLSPRNLAIPFALSKSESECAEIISKIKPDLVFSKGGYVSVPVVAAAAKLKIPVLSHESDLSPGLANKINAKKSLYTLCSFPETADSFKNGKYAGSPLRKELFNRDKNSAMKKYSFSGKKPVLLFLGGGSGSRTVNEALRSVLSPLSKKYDILHICGKGNIIQNNFVGYIQREFEEDMPSAYACADMVVARSGSNTLFEVLALKKKALFIPLENRASRGEQLKNAEYFNRKKLCAVIRERDLDNLYPTIEETFADKSYLSNLAIANIKNGTDDVIREIKNALCE